MSLLIAARDITLLLKVTCATLYRYTKVVLRNTIVLPLCYAASGDIYGVGLALLIMIFM